MFQSYHIKKPCNEILLAGLNFIVQKVSAAYGNGGELLFQDSAGNLLRTERTEELLKRAKFEDRSAEYARGLIAGCGPAEDGTKTALILAADLLEKLQGGAVSSEEMRKGLPEIVEFSKNYLRRTEAAYGALPGAGLYLLTLMRPLIRLCDQEQVGAAGIVASAVSCPLKTLAENNGLVFHEVYERVKATAPNQFYSLHHFGIDGSVEEREPHDAITFGPDIRSKKHVNLLEAGITVPLETALAVLDKTEGIINAFLSVKSVF
ncbi:MAG: hypothetical protein K0R19_2388 [Bacillota bacterium]|nr:hypothetical protein [Bacillota bacterium]